MDNTTQHKQEGKMENEKMKHVGISTVIRFENEKKKRLCVYTFRPDPVYQSK